MRNIYNKKVNKISNEKLIIISLAIFLSFIIFLVLSLAFFSSSSETRGTIKLGEIDFCVYDNINQQQNVMPGSAVECNVNVINSRNINGTNTQSLANFLLRFSIKYNINNQQFENNDNLINAIINNSSMWTENDGHYYYNDKVIVGQSVSICDRLSFSGEIQNEFQNKELNIIFDVDAVQAQNDAYLEVWSEAPDAWKDLIESKLN